MAKTIYLIDPETRVLRGSSPHPIDPVATARAGKPVHALLNPAFATEVEPPRVPAGKRAVLVDASWVLEALPEPAPSMQPAIAPLEDVKPTEPAPLTLEQRLARLRDLVQQYLDAMARSLGYDDIRTAVTYAEEPAVPNFQHEGRALRAWRSLVWSAWHELRTRVEAGDAAEPAEDQLADVLPRLAIPPIEQAASPADPPVAAEGADPEPTDTPQPKRTPAKKKPA